MEVSEVIRLVRKSFHVFRAQMSCTGLESFSLVSVMQIFRLGEFRRFRQKSHFGESPKSVEKIWGV